MKALVCESYGPIDDLQVKDIAPQRAYIKAP